MTVEQAIDVAANGDDHAKQFLFVLWHFAHTMDDIFDEPDRSPDAAARMAMAIINWTETVGANPFFQAYRDILFGAVRTSLLQWVSSEDLKAAGGVPNTVISNVLKSGYQDVLFLVASLRGGPALAIQLQREFRGYDFD